MKAGHASRSRPHSGRENETGCGQFLRWFDSSYRGAAKSKGN